VGRAARSIAFDGGLLVLADDDRLFLLDDRAEQIWRATEAGVSPAEITKALADANPTQAGTIGRDVEALVSRWSAEGLLGEIRRAAERPANSLASVSPVWAGKWRCRFRNLVVDLAVENAKHAQLLGRLLGQFPAEGSSAAISIEVRESADGEAVTFVNGHEYARNYCLRNVQRAIIERVWADDPLCALLHAGAVTLGDKGACLPGISGSGKTTLIARLVGQGLTYLADDMTPISMCGRILPWPMPMSVKLDSWGVLSAHHPTLEEAPTFEVKGTRARALNPATEAWQSGPTQAHVLIFPKFVPGGATQVKSLRPFDALQRVIEAGILLESPITEERVEALRWVGTVPAYALSYGDVDDAASEAVRLLENT
jgi:hypothetical protein